MATSVPSVGTLGAGCESVVPFVVMNSRCSHRISSPAAICSPWSALSANRGSRAFVSAEPSGDKPRPNLKLAVSAEFPRQGTDELLYGPFAAEVKRLLGEKHLRASGGGDDDAATVVEAPGGFFQREEDALGVDIEDPIVILLGTFRQRLDDYLGGVGHYDIQGPDRTFRFVEQAGDFGRARQVCLDGGGPSPRFRGGLYHLAGPGVILEGVDHHRRPLWR